MINHNVSEMEHPGIEPSPQIFIIINMLRSRILAIGRVEDDRKGDSKRTIHNQHIYVCVNLSLFILATGCPYRRVLQNSISHFVFWRIVQDTHTERCPNSRTFSWFFKCQVFKHSYTGLRFQILSERLICQPGN
jgi:hypothetical protein